MFQSMSKIFSKTHKSLMHWWHILFRQLFGHWSLLGKIIFEGHSSGHTDSNDTSLEFLSCEGLEKGRSHTHRRNKDNVYIDLLTIFFTKF
jgi:hypothetical protein